MIYLYQKQLPKMDGKTTRMVQSAIAYQMLAYGLKEEYGILEPIKIYRTSLGKPYLSAYSQIHFNLSHCSAGIACAIHKNSLGVDIERQLVYKDTLARRITHENEWVLLANSPDKDTLLTRIWVAKESYLKYHGTGINQDMRKIDLSGCCKDFFQWEHSSFQIWQESTYCMAVCEGGDSLLQWNLVVLKEDAMEHMLEAAMELMS